MTAEIIGPFTLNGDAVQNAALRDMAKRLTGALGGRISGVEVLFRPGDQLQKKAGTTFVPRGLTVSAHRILMHEAIGKYDEAKTFAHEAMHVLDMQCFTDQQRNDILKLMTPAVAKWDAKDYNDRAYEAFACYASAALGGLNWPVYTEFYDHAVAKSEWPKLASLAVAVYPDPNTPPPPPDPTPTDPRDAQIVALQQQVAADGLALSQVQAERDAARAELTEVNAHTAVLVTDLETLDSKRAEILAHANDITTLAAAG